MRVRGELAPQHVGVSTFLVVIELAADRAGELVNHGSHVDEVEGSHALLENAGGLVEQAQIRFDLLGRARALHLDGDRVSVRQHGSVHLPDRGRRHRLFLELEEEPLQRLVEVLLNDAPHLAEGERLDIVLQPAQLADHVGRKHVRSHRKQLTELDEGRAELLEHRA